MHEGELTPEAIVSTMMHGIGFSEDAMLDVPGRYVAVRSLLAENGYRMKLDQKDHSFWAEKTAAQ